MRYSMQMGEVATPFASGAVTLQILRREVARFDVSITLFGAGPGLPRCDHPGSFVSCLRRGPDARLPETKSGAGRLIEDALIARRPTCRDALKGYFSLEDHPIKAWDEVVNVKLTPAFLLTQQLGRLAMISASFVQIIIIVLIGGLVGQATTFSKAFPTARPKTASSTSRARLPQSWANLVLWSTRSALASFRKR
jgi:NAD(P)-dependent dehydrogenase (short-subunit alcohol dehydrogenase family)